MSARLLKDPATAGSRIFVGHLQTDDMTKHELEEHFSKYGNVIGSLLHRGFAFVQFEEEQSAQNAIKNEDGAMFKGRRIDVRPAKKDGGGNRNMNNTSGNGPNSNFGNNGPFGKPQGGSNNQINAGNNQFNNSNNTFKGNQSFGAGNQSFGLGNQSFGGGNQSFNNTNPGFGKDNQFGNESQFNNSQKGSNTMQSSNDDLSDNANQNQDNGNTSFTAEGDPFNNSNQNKGENNQFNAGMQNRSGNQFPQGSNQNKLMFNQNRNQGIGGNTGGNQNQGGVGGVGGRPRGTRGGKNRNKNRDSGTGNNFRDRSPIGRGNRSDDMSGGRDWEHNKQPTGGNNFGRDTFNDNANRYNLGSGPRDMNLSFNSSSAPSDYPSAGSEKNDCEIIVVNKTLTEYAEAIELRLKKIGLTVDLLFPNEDVLLSRVLGNIASRGCLYAVVVTPTNKEHHSLTLNILHGLPQEHRNMPVEDAINLITRDFANYKSGGRSVPLNTPFANERHPDPIQVLLNMLADNHQLTVLQYDRVIKYLEVKREEQVQVELGDAKDLPTTALTVSDPKQVELQSRILNILNSNKTASTVPAPSPVPAPTPVSAPVPAPVPPANWGTASSGPTATPTTTTSTGGVAPSPLLNDPTVQKALDSLLQGNLLKNIGDQPSSATTPAKTPLFAAFPNIGRF